MGVTREWFHVVARQLFDPKAGYFRPTTGGKTMEVNPGSSKFSNLGGAHSLFSLGAGGMQITGVDS